MKRLSSLRQKVSLTLTVAGTIIFLLIAAVVMYIIQADQDGYTVANMALATYESASGEKLTAKSNTVSTVVSQLASAGELNFVSVYGERSAFNDQDMTFRATTTQQGRVTLLYAYTGTSLPTSLPKLDRTIALDSSDSITHQTNMKGNANQYVILQFSARANDGTSVNSNYYFLDPARSSAIELFSSGGTAPSPATTTTPSVTPAPTATPTASPTPPASTGSVEITSFTAGLSGARSFNVSMTTNEPARYHLKYWYASNLVGGVTCDAPNGVIREIGLSTVRVTEVNKTNIFTMNANSTYCFQGVAVDSSGQKTYSTAVQLKTN